jgi:methylenetetrahydrofolate dehydrogenase (NADP+)/methenyltetrahydrofolate cyclohydrolase
MALLDGRELAKKLTEQIKQKIEASDIRPGLAVVLVGSDPSSHLYVKLKEKAAHRVGIHFERHERPADATEDEIIEVVRSLNDRSDIHGVVIQLPLPKPLTEDRIIDALLARKDADGFHPDNVQALLHGDPVLQPALVRSIFALLDTGDGIERGQRVALVARESVFTNVMSFLLHQKEVQVDIVPPMNHFAESTRRADVLIVAAGKANLITAEHVKEGATVIDIGINQLNGTVVGDVAFDEVAPRVKWITPVPGGVGPVTVAMLLHNTYELSRPQIAPPDIRT